jgi:hypothetical protein
MALSKRSLDTLIDLVEIKISCMEVWDREDRREIANLQQASAELRALAGGGDAPLALGLNAAKIPAKRSRGRPRQALATAH